MVNLCAMLNVWNWYRVCQYVNVCACVNMYVCSDMYINLLLSYTHTEDYTPTTIEYSIFGRCNCITLPDLIIDDIIFEPNDEDFVINLSSDDADISNQAGSITITIIDNDILIGMFYI